MKKFVSSFANCKIRVPVSEEKDNLLSIASSQEIKNLIPNVDTESNTDLLPVAFDACVVNKFNKNDDGMDSSVAVASAKNFIYKPINIEHKREKIAGVILTANFTSLNGHNILSEEDAKASKDPFYITLGGVLWKTVKPELTDYIENCSDPESPDYENVSASWELAFETYAIALRTDNSRLVNGSQLIDDQSEIDKIESSLRSTGGSGKWENKKVYRLLTGNVTPIGIGLTENPAAEVKGVACNTQDKKESSASLEEKNQKLDKNISQSEKLNVTKDDTVINMKLSSLDQIVDSGLKDGQITASSLVEFISNKIKEADEAFQKAKSEAETAQNQASEKINSLTQEQAALATKNAELEKKLLEVQNALAAELAQRDFNVRMEYFDSTYELSPESKKTIAADLNGISSDADFKAYQTKMASLLKKKEEKPVVVVASETPKTPETVVDTALKNATPVVGSVPNVSVITDESYKSKYAEAFKTSNFTIQVGRNRSKN